MLFLILIPNIVDAKTVYFTNVNGVELTKQQYENLSKVFSYDTIATLNEEQINLYKNNTNLKAEKTFKYIKIEKDNVKNVYKESIVTQQEVEEFLNKSTRGSTHQTTMKKVSISLLNLHSVKTVTVTNEWFSIPSTKSFDVIGFRNGVSTPITINSVSGYQKWDGNLISYNNSSSNIKRNTNGCGLSTNISDNVTQSLSNSISVTFYNNELTYTAYGTYQHAQSNVTLSESQNYSFSANGLGGVLNFASSVRGKYDGMQGVNITSTAG